MVASRALPTFFCLVLASLDLSQADEMCTVIDFESTAAGCTLGEGSTVSELTDGCGINGETAFGGVVTASATSVSQADDSINAAMIFDSTCGGGGVRSGCTGGDTDLFAPDLGNILIISEDGDSADPDDDGRGGVINIQFPDVVTIKAITFQDVDEIDQGVNSASATLIFTNFDGFPTVIDYNLNDNLPAGVGINDGDTYVLDIESEIGVPAVKELQLQFLGLSGGIDNIEICTGGDAFQGCTPGFWKNNKNQDSWCDGIETTTVYADVFGVEVPEGLSSDLTFLDALKQGGGGVNALLRHSAAAYLNACSGGVSYAIPSPETVIFNVQTAFDSGEYEPSRIFSMTSTKQVALLTTAASRRNQDVGGGCYCGENEG